MSSVKKLKRKNRKIEKEKSYDRRAENKNVKKRKKKKKMVRKENFLQVDNFGVCFNVKKKFCFPIELQLKNGNNAERLGRLLSLKME